MNFEKKMETNNYNYVIQEFINISINLNYLYFYYFRIIYLECSANDKMLNIFMSLWSKTDI